MLTVILCTLGVQWYVFRRLLRLPSITGNKVRRRAVILLFALSSLWMIVAVPGLMSHSVQILPPAVMTYLMAASLFWVITVVSAAMWLAMAHPRQFDPSRRQLLAVAAPLAAAPLVSAGFGFVSAREGLHLAEVPLKVKGLPPDLDGLRIVQLTDIHFGPFFGRVELERSIAMANEARPHLAVLTGDLITRHGDDLDGCLELLRKLRPEAGIYGCHGNHETYSGVLNYCTQRGAGFGFHFLRGRAVGLRFGNAVLNVAGHDYQRKSRTYLPGVESLVRPGAVNMLLQHNPDVFPRAAAAGFDITLSGHTHGGQVNFEILHENLNVARFFTPFVRGEYELNGRRVYVSSGMGTIGVPVRIGAPPELTLIKLCAA